MSWELGEAISGREAAIGHGLRPGKVERLTIGDGGRQGGGNHRGGLNGRRLIEGGRGPNGGLIDGGSWGRLEERSRSRHRHGGIEKRLGLREKLGSGLEKLLGLGEELGLGLDDWCIIKDRRTCLEGGLNNLLNWVRAD